METVRTMPLWVDVFIAIVAALGGWEAIKYLISLGANRRKDKAEAQQEETTAAQQQAIVAAAKAGCLPCLEKGYIRVVLEFGECSCCNG